MIYGFIYRGLMDPFSQDRISVTDAGNGGKKTVTTWRYEGARLVAIDHPDQAERYSYDPQGAASAPRPSFSRWTAVHTSVTRLATATAPWASWPASAGWKLRKRTRGRRRAYPSGGKISGKIKDTHL